MKLLIGFWKSWSICFRSLSCLWVCFWCFIEHFTIAVFVVDWEQCCVIDTDTILPFGMLTLPCWLVFLWSQLLSYEKTTFPSISLVSRKLVSQSASLEHLCITMQMFRSLELAGSEIDHMFRVCTVSTVIKL